MQTIPSLVISHVIRHIMGIAIIGMPIPMPIAGIPPAIIGIGMGMPIIGIPPPIIDMGIGIIGMPPVIIGIPPIIGFGLIMPMPFIIIGMGMGIIIGIPPDDGLIPLPIIGIALIGVIVGLLGPRRRASLT